MRTHERKQAFRSQRITTSLMLTLLALASISAVTVAWFSIADNTKVQSMSMDVSAGLSLRFDLDSHESFEDYFTSIPFSRIAQRIRNDKGFDMTETPLEPVTTNDGKTFVYESGQAVESTNGAYLEFTLHFMALKDTVVHLTSANSAKGKEDGTRISSPEANLPPAMRISFTQNGKTVVYDPGAPAGSSESGGIRTFGLPDADYMKLSEDNALFSLPKETDQPVVLRIWLEGTDEACDNRLKGMDYSIQLRFEGGYID